MKNKKQKTKNKKKERERGRDKENKLFKINYFIIIKTRKKIKNYITFFFFIFLIY